MTEWVSERLQQEELCIFKGNNGVLFQYLLDRPPLLWDTFSFCCFSSQTAQLTMDTLGAYPSAPHMDGA